MGDIAFFNPFPEGEGNVFNQYEVTVAPTIFQIVYAISRAWLTNRVLVTIYKNDIQHKQVQQNVSYSMGHFTYNFDITEEIRLANASLDAYRFQSVGENETESAKLKQLKILAELFREMFDDPINAQNDNLKKFVADLEKGGQNPENRKYGILRFLYHPLFINRNSQNVSLASTVVDPVMRLQENPKKLDNKKYWIDIDRTTEFADKIQNATKDTILSVLFNLSKATDNQIGLFLNRCADNFACMDSAYVNQLIQQVEQKEQKNKEYLKTKYGGFFRSTMKQSFLESATFIAPKNISDIQRLFKDTLVKYIQFVQQLQFCYLADPKLAKIDRFGAIDNITAQKLLEPINPQQFKDNVGVKDSFAKVLTYLYSTHQNYKLDEIKDEFVDIGGLLDRLHLDKGLMTIFRDKSYVDELSKEFGYLGYFYKEDNALKLRSKVKIAQAESEKNEENSEIFMLHNKNKDRIGYLDKSEYAKFLYFNYAMFKINSERSAIKDQSKIDEYDQKMRKSFFTVLNNGDFKQAFEKGFDLDEALKNMNGGWDTKIDSLFRAIKKSDEEITKTLEDVEDAEGFTFFRKLSEKQKEELKKKSYYKNGYIMLVYLNKVENTMAIESRLHKQDVEGERYYDMILQEINNLWQENMKSDDPAKKNAIQKVKAYLPDYFKEPLPQTFQLRDDNVVVVRRLEGIYGFRQEKAYIGIPICSRNYPDKTVEFEKRVQQLVHIFMILFGSQEDLKQSVATKESDVSGTIQAQVSALLPKLGKLLVMYFLQQYKQETKPSASPAPAPTPSQKDVPAAKKAALSPKPIPESDDEKTEEAPEEASVEEPEQPTFQREEWMKNPNTGKYILGKDGKRIPKPYIIDKDGYVKNKRDQFILDENGNKLKREDYEPYEIDIQTGELVLDEDGKKQTIEEHKKRIAAIQEEVTKGTLDPKTLPKGFQESIRWENATYNWNNLAKNPAIQHKELGITLNTHPANFVNLPFEEFEKNFSKSDKLKIIMVCFNSPKDVKDINYSTSFAAWQDHFREKYNAGITEEAIRLRERVGHLEDIENIDKQKFLGIAQFFNVDIGKTITLDEANEGVKQLIKFLSKHKKLQTMLETPLRILEITNTKGELKENLQWIEAGTQASTSILIRNRERMCRVWHKLCVMIGCILAISPDGRNKRKALQKFVLPYAQLLERGDIDTFRPIGIGQNLSTIKNILENIERDEVYCKDGVYQHDLLQHGIFNTIEEYADKHWETISKSVPWKATFERMNVVPGGVGLDASWGHDVSTKYLHCLSLIADVLDSLDNERLVEEDLLVRCNAEWPKEKITN